MRYGTVNLRVKEGSLGFVNRKSQEIRHYPGTDLSDVIPNGKLPTTVRATLIAHSEEELFLIQQLLHAEGVESELHFGSFFYKRVVTGDSGEPKPQTRDEKIWLIDAEFIALDPIPYRSSTGEAAY